MSGQSGGSGNTQTTTTPWAPQQPYLQQLFGGAQSAFQNPPAYYPNAGYVPFAPQQQQAMARTEQRAGGSPTESAFNHYLQGSLGQNQINLGGAAQGAGQYLGGIGTGQNALTQLTTPGATNMAGLQGMTTLGATANGSMLNSNPYLDSMFGQASRQLTNNYQNVVNPSINATFGGAGRTGSNAQTGALGDAAGQYGDSLAGLASSIYGGNYANERQNQLGAANSLSNLYQGGQSNALQAGLGLSQNGLGGIGALGGLYGNISADQARAGAFAPSASAMDWNNIDRLMGVGSQVQGQAGNILQDSMARYNFGQNNPWNQVQNYGASLYGLPGSYGSQTAPGIGGSQTAGAIGGGLSGAAIGRQVTPNSWWGPALGGLLGAFGGYQ